MDDTFPDLGALSDEELLRLIKEFEGKAAIVRAEFVGRLDRRGDWPPSDWPPELGPRPDSV